MRREYARHPLRHPRRDAPLGHCAPRRRPDHPVCASLLLRVDAHRAAASHRAHLLVRDPVPRVRNRRRVLGAQPQARLSDRPGAHCRQSADSRQDESACQ